MKIIENEHYQGCHYSRPFESVGSRSNVLMACHFCIETKTPKRCRADDCTHYLKETEETKRKKTSKNKKKFIGGQYE